MGQRIIDLDVLVPSDLAVRIDETLYKLPSDIPVPEYLGLSQAFDRVREIEAEETKTPELAAEATELLEEIYERVMDLFRVHNPDLESLSLGPRRLGALIIAIYANLAEEETAAPARPTRPRTGTKSSSRKRQTRSSSSK